MADNGDRRFQKVLEGIQYLIKDNEHLRAELKDLLAKGDEDRRRSDQRFEHLTQRSDERFERLIERTDDKFNVVLDQVKRTNRVAVEVARDIRRQLQEGQQQTNRLLDAILKRLPPGSNGK